MQLKKLFAVGLTAIMMSSLLVGCSSKTESNEDVYKIGMISDTGGVNDESFNQSTWEGLQQAQEKYGKDKVQVKYVESSQEADYTPNIETFVEEDLDLIIGVGYQLKDSIEESAKNYPEQKFAILDETYDTIQENVIPVVFKEEESAYLVGVMAAKMSKTNKVGFIGGLPAPSVVRYQYGYKYGVTNTNKDTQILEQYVNSFTDQAKGKAIANQMYSNGADIVFTCGGDVGTGAIEAAKENKKMAIGVDIDQNPLAPENVISSTVKNINVSIINLVGEILDGNYQGGQVIVNTLASGGVGIAKTTDKNVPADILKYVEEQAELVKSGEIKVPQNEKEYNEIVGK